jgi:ribokinase
MKKIDIIGLGEVVVDWVTEVPHFPKLDEKIDAISENHFPGGVTANYLVAVARLGVNCGFVGAVGADSYGDYLIEDFKKENIDISLTLKKDGKKTPVNFIFVAEGEKTIIQSPHMQTTKIELSDLNFEYISRAKHLHTTLIHSKISKKVIEFAKQNNISISIDLESQIAQKGWRALAEDILKCDVLIPNKEGAKVLTKSATPREAANILIAKGVPVVIITLGDKGVLITTNEYQKIIPAYEVKEIIDTTGAGDAFNGAFSVGYWIKGWDIEKSCRFANGAAACKIQKLGARTGMPTEKELLNFLKINEDPFF